MKIFLEPSQIFIGQQTMLNGPPVVLALGPNKIHQSHADLVERRTPHSVLHRKVDRVLNHSEPIPRHLVLAPDIAREELVVDPALVNEAYSPSVIDEAAA